MLYRTTFTSNGAAISLVPLAFAHRE